MDSYYIPSELGANVEESRLFLRGLGADPVLYIICMEILMCTYASPERSFLFHMRCFIYLHMLPNAKAIQRHNSLYHVTIVFVMSR